MSPRSPCPPVSANIHAHGRCASCSGYNCLISRVHEQQYGLNGSNYPNANGQFKATGDGLACAGLCGSWGATFTTWPSSYTWQSKVFSIDTDFNGKLSYRCDTSWNFADDHYCFGLDGDGLTKDDKTSVLVILPDGTAVTPLEPGKICNPTAYPVPKASCSIRSNATSGYASTVFDLNWSAKNSVKCTWELDGVNKGTVDCNRGSPISGLSVGNHTIRVYPSGVTHFGPNGFGSTVGLDPAKWASGPLKAGDSCAVTLNIKPPPPTCTVSISPTSGVASDIFKSTWSTSGVVDSCTFKVDDGSVGSTPCSGKDHVQTVLSVGKHTVTMYAKGPGGTSSCSDSYTVKPPAPTCTVTVLPGTGKLSTNTTMTSTWSSTNATTCSFRKDLGAYSPIACNGTGPFPASYFGTGTHTITVKAVGAGGTKTCRSNTVTISP